MRLASFPKLYSKFKYAVHKLIFSCSFLKFITLIALSIINLAFLIPLNFKKSFKITFLFHFKSYIFYPNTRIVWITQNHFFKIIIILRNSLIIHKSIFFLSYFYFFLNSLSLPLFCG